MRCRSRPPVWCAITLALVLSACASGGDGETDPGGQAAATSSPASPPVGSGSADATWYDAEEMAVAQDDVAVVWLAGWFVPEALDGVTIADLEVRYRRVTGLPGDAPAEQLAQMAFAAMADPGPVELVNFLDGVSLRLLSGRVEARDGTPTAVLDFDAGIAATNQLGDYAPDAETQFHAMVREYFPEAVQVAVTVDGAGAELFGGKAYGTPVALAR